MVQILKFIVFSELVLLPLLLRIHRSVSRTGVPRLCLGLPITFRIAIGVAIIWSLSCVSRWRLLWLILFFCRHRVLFIYCCLRLSRLHKDTQKKIVLFINRFHFTCPIPVIYTPRTSLYYPQLEYLVSHKIHIIVPTTANFKNFIKDTLNP